MVLLRDTALTEAAAATLRRHLPSGLEVKTWLDLAELYTSTAALYERQFAVLQAIIVVMVVLGVANSVSMTLHERTSEFGTMRALGNTGRDTFRLAVLEAAVLGAAGATLGVVVGSLAAVSISAIGVPMPPPPNSESGFTGRVQLVPSIILAAWVLGFLSALVASLLPARRLARIRIVEALRRGL